MKVFSLSSSEQEFSAALQSISGAICVMDRLRSEEEEKKTPTTAGAAGAAADAAGEGNRAGESGRGGGRREQEAMRVSERVMEVLEKSARQRRDSAEGEVAALLREQEAWNHARQDLEKSVAALGASMSALKLQMTELQKNLVGEMARASRQEHHMDVFLNSDFIRFQKTQHDIDSKLSALLDSKEAQDRDQAALRKAQRSIEELSAQLTALQVENNILRSEYGKAISENENLGQTLDDAKKKAKQAESDWMQSLQQISLMQEILMQNQPETSKAVTSDNGTDRNGHDDTIAQELRRKTEELDHANKLLAQISTFDEEAIQATAMLVKQILHKEETL